MSNYVHDNEYDYELEAVFDKIRTDRKLMTTIKIAYREERFEDIEHSIESVLRQMGALHVSVSQVFDSMINWSGEIF